MLLLILIIIIVKATSAIEVQRSKLCVSPVTPKAVCFTDRSTVFCFSVYARTPGSGKKAHYRTVSLKQK